MSTDDRGTHDHDHDHEHPGTTPDVNETGYYELMAEAMKELLIEKGVVSADDVRRNLEFLDSRDPVDGGRVIAKAWTDPDFKKRLLEDGTAAVGEMGLTMGDAELVVVENTDDVHNMIVCTLCSCYPRTLGLRRTGMSRLPVPRRGRTARRAEGIRHRSARQSDRPGPRFQRRHALSCPAKTA